MGAALGFLLTLSILKGARMPNRWAATHALFTYQTGFMKRALWGELLWLVFGRWTASYFFVAGAGIILLSVSLVAIWRACRRVPPVSDRLAFLLVFLASPALAFFVHLVGYLEQIAYLAWFPVLALRRHWRAQVAAAMVAAGLLPLVHEASVLWVGGLMGLAVVTSGDPRATPRARFAALGAISLLWIVATMAVVTLGRVSPARAEAIRQDRTAFFSIRPRQDAFAALAVPLRDSLADMRVRWAGPHAERDMALSLAVFGPALIFLAVMALRRARALEAPPSIRTAAVLLTIAAVVGPLLLHVVAWDRQRWNASAALNAGLAALTLLLVPATAAHEAARRRHAALPGLALAICLWSVSADPIFFDYYQPAHPPFGDQIKFLIDAVRTPNANAWIPAKGE